MKIQTVNQRRSPSLIDFLLGDGIHPGWLDEQRHHAFAPMARSWSGSRTTANFSLLRSGRPGAELNRSFSSSSLQARHSHLL